jgi:hypothetical protein
MLAVFQFFLPLVMSYFAYPLLLVKRSQIEGRWRGTDAVEMS